MRRTSAMQPYQPDEVLRPSKSRNLLWLLACAALFVGGFLTLRHAKSAWDEVKGYACVILFGLSGLICIVGTLPGCNYLRLGRDGLTVCRMWRKISYRWSDIERCGVAEFRFRRNGLPIRNQMVGMDFSSTYQTNGKATRRKDSTRQRFGFDDILPNSHDANWNCQKLADHLNELRKRFPSGERKD